MDICPVLGGFSFRGAYGVGLIGVHTVFVGHSSAGQILSFCATVGAMGRDSFKLLLSIAPMASQKINMCSGEGWPTEAVCTQIIHQCKPHNKTKATEAVSATKSSGNKSIICKSAA